MEKSAGIHELKAEMTKYGPMEVCQGIAEIFNEIAETGVYPSEVKEGVLIPLQKPGKGRTTRKPTTNHPFYQYSKDPSNMYARTMFRKTPAESTTHAGSLPTRSKYDRTSLHF